MIFKNSLSIFSGNIDTLFKVILYSFILLLICLAILVAIIRPILGGLFDAVEVTEQLQETVNTWLEGESGSFAKFFKDAAATFSDNSGRLWSVFFLVMLFYALLKFFLLLTYVPLSKVLYHKMSASYTKKFYTAFIGSLGKSLLFALAHTIMTIFIDAAIILGGYYLLRLIYPAFKVLSLPISISVGLILLAIKTSLLNQWVPYIICGKKQVLPALKSGLTASAKNLKTIFPSVLLLYVALFGLVMTTLLSTFGVIPIIAVAAFMLMQNAVGLVTYFKNNNLKFYTHEIEIEKA